MSRARAPHRLPARIVALTAAVGLVAVIVAPALASDPTAHPRRSDAPRPGRAAWDPATPKATGTKPATGTQLIVRFRDGSSGTARRRATALPGVTRLRDLPSSGIAVVRTADADPAAAIAEIEADPQVLDVTLDHQFFRDDDPQGESFWSEQWGMDNTGQRIYQGAAGSEGHTNIDIDGRQALAVTEGDPNVIVAVIDDGVDFSHPDLAGRAWTNPGETGTDANGNDKQTNGQDDDNDGYPDDVHGWDFCHDDATVHHFDEDFHGTHVAGTIAASLDGDGVVGVAPQVQIMALKFIDGSTACGHESQAIAAIAYAKHFGVRIANTSWGVRAGKDDIPNLKNAIAHSGMLFVASAGNYGINNDTDEFPALPASYDLPNVLSVAAVDNRGRMPAFSDYGKKTVDIAAPGVGILSSLPADSDHPDPGWGWLDGTSMAAPHVTGVAALVISRLPGLASNPAAVKARILATGKSVTGAKGRTTTGKIVDAFRAVDIDGPTAKAPTSFGFARGSILGRTTVRASAGWPAATDDLTGVAAYRAGQRTDAGVWTTLVSETAARSVSSTLTLRHIATFRVRARDVSGNWGAYVSGPDVRPSVTQESGAGAVYTGGWGHSRNASWSGGTTRFTRKTGATATFTFHARAFALVAPKGPTRGSFRLYIDETYAGTISLHRSSSLARVLVATRTWTTLGDHTVKIVVVGTAHHPRVDVDALVLMR